MEREILIDTGSSQLFLIKNFTKDHFKDISKLKLEHEPEVNFFGKKCTQNRNVGFFSNESEGYKYSGVLMKSQPFDNPNTLFLQKLIEKVNEELDFETNGILVNEYVDGSKYIGSHSDSEINLDSSYVAAISYGVTRKFRVRLIGGKGYQDFDHEPCSLLVMAGNFQSEYKHEIPKQLKIKDSRFSLTFRKHYK
jgi:alkylated DNA repair dioxygenase AlkB